MLVITTKIINLFAFQHRQGKTITNNCPACQKPVSKERIWPKAILLTVVLIFMTIGYTTIPMASQKIDLLQQKIADLQLLDTELERQIAQAELLQAKLTKQKTELEQEITDINRLLKLQSFKKAFENPRFKYDLELISTLEAYIDVLEQKIEFYQIGRDRVAFLLQLAQDDIKMLAALNDLRIDALTTQISLLITKYLPEAHTIVLATGDLKKPSAKTIWNRITAKF